MITKLSNCKIFNYYLTCVNTMHNAVFDKKMLRHLVCRSSTASTFSPVVAWIPNYQCYSIIGTKCAENIQQDTDAWVAYLSGLHKTNTIIVSRQPGVHANYMSISTGTAFITPWSFIWLMPNLLWRCPPTRVKTMQSHNFWLIKTLVGYAFWGSDESLSSVRCYSLYLDCSDCHLLKASRNKAISMC